MPTEMVAAYPGTARLGLTPNGSHQGQSSPEWGTPSQQVPSP